MRDFLPGQDFESAEGRQAIRKQLEEHPDVARDLLAHGDPTPEEKARWEQSPFHEVEDLSDFILTDRYWHGLHRVAPPTPEAFVVLDGIRYELPDKLATELRKKVTSS